MKSGLSGRVGTAVLLLMTALVCAPMTSVHADVVLCQSALLGSVHAREGRCLGGETEVTMSAHQETRADTGDTAFTRVNATQKQANVECDANEDLYWVKDNVPLN